MRMSAHAGLGCLSSGQPQIVDVVEWHGGTFSSAVWRRMLGTVDRDERTVADLLHLWGLMCSSVTRNWPPPVLFSKEMASTCDLDAPVQDPAISSPMAGMPAAVASVDDYGCVSDACSVPHARLLVCKGS
jgi:hypothetical protein